MIQLCDDSFISIVISTLPSKGLFKVRRHVFQRYQKQVAVITSDLQLVTKISELSTHQNVEDMVNIII